MRKAASKVSVDIRFGGSADEANAAKVISRDRISIESLGIYFFSSLLIDFLMLP
jgi:hypothetical protein